MEKWFGQSKTLWGIVVAALPQFLPLLGVNLTADDVHLISQAGDAIFTAIGLVLAAYGRAVAYKKPNLTLTGGL